MTKYRPKGNEVTAIKFTGNNVATVQNFVGERKIDLSGKITVPNFDDATDWVPGALEGQYALWSLNNWTVVEPGSWIIRDGPNLTVLDDASFQERFEEVPSEQG